MHTEDAPVGGSDEWFERELAQLNAQLDEIAAWLKTRPATPAPLPRWRPSVTAESGSAAAESIGRGLAASAREPVGPDLRASRPGAGEAGAAGGEQNSGQGGGGRPDRPSTDAAAADRGSTSAVSSETGVGPDLRAGRPAAPAASAEPPLPTGTDLSDPKNFGMMPPLADLEQGNASAEDYRQRLGKHLAFATTVLHTSKVPAAVWREWRGFEKAIHERLMALAAPASDVGL